MKKRFLPFALLLFLFNTVFGQVWSPKAEGVLPSNYNVSDISIVSDQVIWATAIDYSQANPPVPPTHITKLMKSTDGGNTWVVKDIEEIMGRVSWDIHAFNDTTAIITTQNLQSPAGRGLWRTTDGGGNWAELLPGTAGGGKLLFFDDQEGICITANLMERTTDGGESWTPVPSGNIPAFQSGEFTLFSTAGTALPAIGNILWLGTNQGRVFKSEDRGQTWNATPMGLGGNFIYSMAFVDEKNGIALHATDYQLAKTSDGGETWASLSYDYEFNEVAAIPCSNILMGVSWEDNITAISTDLGETWELKDNSISAWAPKFKSPNLGWMAEGAETGANAALYKWIGGTLDGRTYVNQAATGNNDGTSWADAYIDLQDALAASEEGNEIWVAEGTYLPDTAGGSPSSTFLIDENLKLYGGFAGTECNLSERDIQMYPTILSGDLNGDDVLDDFVMNRGDNVMTVVTITADITNETLVDGFTIRNGHADGGGINDSQTTGGAVYSLGGVVIGNCFFLQNYAMSRGGAVQVQNQSAQGFTIENCRFKKNQSTNLNGDAVGGALYATGVVGEGITILQTTFDDNTADWGSGVNLLNSNGFFDDVTFINNVNPRQGGALRFTSNFANTTLSVLNSTFEGNSAAFGGGAYTIVQGDGVVIQFINTTFKENTTAPVLDGWGSGGSGISYFIDSNAEKTHITIDQCVFENNTTEGSGGGARIANNGDFTNIQVNNCSFAGNESIFHGGGFHVNANETSNQTNIAVDSCSFSENTVEMWTGSGFRALLLGQNVDLTLSNSSFTQNTTGLAGAAAIYGFEVNSSGQTKVDQCVFQNNSSGYDAGLSIGSGTRAGFFEHTITNCNFLNNSSTFDAGGLDTYSEVPTKFLVTDCLFDGNSAGGTAGGFYIANTHPDVESTIRNCIWQNNESPKGAAIGGLPFVEEIEDFATTMEASFTFENCLIHNNTSDTAAIALKQTGNVTLLNCTVANNQAGALALDSLSAVTLQNTILHNPGFVEFTDLTGTSTTSSLGGNLISDGSLQTYALTYDLQNEPDPLFTGIGDFRLQNSSPAIDKGVDLGNLPATDLDGNDRRYMDGCVDIGAYEAQVIGSADCVTDIREMMVIGSLVLSPNPATDFVNIELPETITTPIEISLFDTQGKLMRQQFFTNGQTLQVRHLPNGFYSLKVTDGDRVYVGKFVKQ